jgi:hypothetical protein
MMAKRRSFDTLGTAAGTLIAAVLTGCSGSPFSPTDDGLGAGDGGAASTQDAPAEPQIDANPAHESGTSACDGVTRRRTMSDPFIADFEDNSSFAYDYGPTGPLNALSIAGPGAVGTGKAAHLSKPGLITFGGMGLQAPCWDVSALSGISFWAKGTAGADNVIQIQVAIPATHAVANGGDCTKDCFDHPSKKVTLTADWKQYTAAWSELTQAGFGAPAKFEGIMMAINWVSLGGPGVDFWVDEVAFYSGSPTAGPVGLDAGAH